MTHPALRCTSCGRQPSSETVWRCTCGGAFDLVAPHAIELPDVDPTRRASGMWRFRSTMQLPTHATPVTLGEGDTPMVTWTPGPKGSRRWLKLESASPTGSFKDRGAAVLASVAHATGALRLVCDSSGNMGAAISAYAARAGIRCEVYVPSGTSPAKLAQARAYGAKVVEVEGDRSAVAAEAQRTLGDGFYASHYWNPYFLEGTKTVAYEIFEHLEGKLPDHVVVPVGHGTLWLGLLRGFDELRYAGRTTSTPRIHVVQAAACGPIVEALGAPSLGARPGTVTIAEGIRVAHPPRLRQIVEGLVRTGSRAVTVDDDAILAAHDEVARTGTWIEPTAAVALAGANTLETIGAIAPSEVVVVTVTGHGLKSPRPTA